MRRTIIACALTALAVGTGTAAAANLITSKDIADGTIQSRDIHRDTISLNRLTPGVRALIAQAGKPGVNGVNGVNGVSGKDGVNGKNGDQGVAGPIGPQGAPGPTGATGPEGPQGPAGTSGALPVDFGFTNDSVRLTSSGVQFGPYADGGTAGGSLYYSGLNGHTLNEIANLYYQARYSTDNHVNTAVPYLRVFLNGDSTDVIFSPNTQPTPATAEGVFHKWVVTDGTVRYGDDAGNGPDSPWSDVVTDHGTDVISGIYVTAGFSAGQNLRVLLDEFGINGQVVSFPPQS